MITGASHGMTESGWMVVEEDGTITWRHIEQNNLLLEYVAMNVKGFFMLVFDIIALLSLISLLSWLTILLVVLE